MPAEGTSQVRSGEEETVTSHYASAPEGFYFSCGCSCTHGRVLITVPHITHTHTHTHTHTTHMYSHAHTSHMCTHTHNTHVLTHTQHTCTHMHTHHTCAHTQHTSHMCTHTHVLTHAHTSHITHVHTLTCTSTEAQQYFGAIKSTPGVTPSPTAYADLMSAYSFHGDHAAIQQLLQEVQSQGLPVKRAMVTHLLEAHIIR